MDAPPAIPADLAAAPAWAGRSLYTGVIRGTGVHTRATLQRVDTRALLTLEIRTASIHFKDGAMEPWGPPATEQYVGTFSADKLEVTRGATAISLDCATKPVAVARAEAVRKRDPKLAGCMGDQGHWVPATTRKAKALICGDTTSEMDPSFTFVAPGEPELEWVYVNDDCSMQGGGYRDIPKDGSIASVR